MISNAPTPAATVVLARELNDSIEVFMVKRPGGAAFPNLHVFPGGKIDSADHLFAATQNSSLDFAEYFEKESEAFAYAAGVVRECFEECGVLLATSVDGQRIRDVRHLDVYRQRLIDAQETLTSFCQKEKLLPDFSQLRYLSHWITPEVAPRRFNVRFFLAAMPEGQAARRHLGETTAGEWICPEAALGRQKSGDWQMIAPTLTTLESICGPVNLPQLLAWIDEGLHKNTYKPADRLQGLVG